MGAFGTWLRESRTAVPADGRPAPSQDQLAELARQADPKSKVYQARLSEWERGPALPNLRQLRAIGAALKLTPDQMSEGRELWDSAQLHDDSIVAAPAVPTL